jgi:hypothetical protein
MKKINVDGGWDPTCGGPPTALVYSPDAAGKFPLLSFAHGMTAGGNKVDRSYSKLLREVAGAGYVIIATQDAPDAFCANMYKDQLKSIDIGKRFRNVDVSKGFGIFGHSMGGQSTFNSAGSKRDIRAAVALHPATFGGSTPKVPILYGTGSSDQMTGCSPRSVKGLYDRTSLSNMNRPGIYNRGKVFANIRGAGHTEPNFGSKWNRFVIAMFDCHIKRNPSSCGVIYGRGRDSLCHGSLNMVQCITAGGDGGGGGVSIPLSNLLDQDDDDDDEDDDDDDDDEDDDDEDDDDDDMDDKPTPDLSYGNQLLNLMTRRSRRVLKGGEGRKDPDSPIGNDDDEDDILGNDDDEDGLWDNDHY